MDGMTTDQGMPVAQKNFFFLLESQKHNSTLMELFSGAQVQGQSTEKDAFVTLLLYNLPYRF